MWRFPRFSAAFLVLLMTTRPWSDPQADPDPPYKPEFNPENPQLQEIFRTMKAMHTEIKTLRRSFSQLSELKTVARRVADLEARLAVNDVQELASSQNETTAAVEELASRQSETATQQQERFAGKFGT
ncbi:Hypp5051 [Branchiostoma lanceolatum]|uniref:Hypp5051 protein n=1 Tax=Branchiostoma lanceolatum TaxID=7740 RepID=A0A8K0F055_BRALA|nr:Hypp5051 [Branchiostoma lanceolatum]